MTFLDFADDEFWRGFVLGGVAVLSIVGVIVLALVDGPRYGHRRRRPYSRRR